MFKGFGVLGFRGPLTVPLKGSIGFWGFGF